LFFFAIISIVAIIVSCNNAKDKKEKESIDAKLEPTTIDFDPDAMKKEDIIFYNLFSPVDLDHMFTEKDAYYKSTLLNPLYNITNYIESSDASLNIGVYGADLSYLWMFNQSQQALSYVSAIQRLTDQLQIPREFVDFSAALGEAHAYAYDSLVQIASRSFAEVDAYLKDNQNPHLACLILLGGYTETMHIAMNINNELDENMISRLAAQKYSINSLYQLMSNYQDNLEISEYLIHLRKLKKAYDKFDITFPEGSLQVDTSHRQILLKKGKKITMRPEQVLEIRMLTNQLRNHIIENI
jgi:hypothetical protein